MLAIEHYTRILRPFTHPSGIDSSFGTFLFLCIRFTDSLASLGCVRSSCEGLVSILSIRIRWDGIEPSPPASQTGTLAS
jgi:hypothetical protein